MTLSIAISARTIGADKKHSNLQATQAFPNIGRTRSCHLRRDSRAVYRRNSASHLVSVVSKRPATKRLRLTQRTEPFHPEAAEDFALRASHVALSPYTPHSPLVSAANNQATATKRAA